MAEILEVVDLEALRKEVRDKYREVAEDPTGEYHFHVVDGSTLNNKERDLGSLSLSERVDVGN